MSGKVNLNRWIPHLEAAKREGVTLAQYARSRGLSRFTLYAAREMLNRDGGNVASERRQVSSLKVKPPVTSNFAAVKISVSPEKLQESAPRLRAQLRHGRKLFSQVLKSIIKSFVTLKYGITKIHLIFWLECLPKILQILIS